MATTVRLISTHLRRTHLYLLRPFVLSTTIFDHPLSTSLPETASFRYFSSHPSDSDFTHQLNSVTESELRILGFIDGSLVADVSESLLNDSIAPIRFIASLLDGFHDVTGIPWWIVIASSTVAMRITMFPWIVLQLHKLKQIGNTFPKLPPPFPPPFSGRSYIDQFSIFWRKRRELGCPSFLWFLASFTVQLPCFLLWMASIRKMSLDQYPGFDTGGILWFQDLTEVPNGLFGPIFPVLIAGLHFCNIQISFRSSFIEEGKGMLSMLAKLYKIYLELLTLPILFVGFHIPQGSLVYWVTNSSLTVLQQLCLQHPVVRKKLGLLGKSPNAVGDSERSIKESTLPDSPRKHGPVSAFDLSPLQLVNVSISYLSSGKLDKALPLLRLAVSKDPDWYVAWTILGQAMLQMKDYEEAAEYLETAIAKIPLEKPYDAEAIDYYIQASLSAGAAYYQQGKVAESFAHFESFRDLEVPENPNVKARYYEGLVCYCSFLANEGRKDEAFKYLRMAAAFDPQYSVFLENLEGDTDNFISDLARSRRGDY